MMLTQYLGDVGVVHIRAGLEDLPPFVLGPYHKGVHRPLDVVAATLTLASTLTDDLGSKNLGCKSR